MFICYSSHSKLTPYHVPSLATHPIHQGNFIHFVFLGPHPQHMEVPRLGVQLELQLPAYATATKLGVRAASLGYIHLSSRQHQILNPLSKARDRTYNLMDTSRVRYR